MPYIKKHRAEFIKKQFLYALVDWLWSIDIERRKGDLAYIVKHLGKYAFTDNYFGLSTGTDAVRSALVELEKDLLAYEAQKRKENGDV